MQSGQSNTISKFPFVRDPATIDEIKKEEVRLTDNLREKFLIQANLKFLRSRLAIPWQKAIEYCLRSGEGEGILKTSMEVSCFIASCYGLEATRDMKNNVSTSISALFNQKDLGRIYINDKGYYGINDYFNQDDKGLFTILKEEYVKQLGL